MPFLEPINNVTVTDFLVTANAYSEDWLGLMILFIIFSILLIRMREFPLEKSFAAASFIVMILGVFFRIIGLFGDLVMGTTIFLAIGSFLLLIMIEKRSSQFF